MTCCDFCDRCFFFNEPLFDNLLSNAESLREKYCAKDFTECAIYTLAMSLGINKVRGYVYPDDIIVNPITTLPKASQPQGDIDMFLKVIYSDGTLGAERSSVIGQLTKNGEIVAFLCSEGWVEVRRKQKKEDYFGKERRHSELARM